MLDAILILAGGIWTGFWRRWFGGLLDKVPVLKYRFVQIVANLLVMCGFFIFVAKFPLWKTGIIVAVIQGLYWCLAHGCYFDVGHSYPPDEKMIKRYNKMPFHRFLDWMFPVSGGERYHAFYDFIGMWIRYGWPTLLLVPFLGWPVLILGASVAAVYGVCWCLQDHSLMKKLGPTELAEIIAGFLSGLVLYSLAL
jgi:hypothetical protein